VEIRSDWLHVVKWMHWYWIGTAFKDWFILNWQMIMHGIEEDAVLYILSNTYTFALDPDAYRCFVFLFVCLFVRQCVVKGEFNSIKKENRLLDEQFSTKLKKEMKVKKTNKKLYSLSAEEVPATFSLASSLLAGSFDSFASPKTMQQPQNNLNTLVPEHAPLVYTPPNEDEEMKDTRRLNSLLRTPLKSIAHHDLNIDKRSVFCPPPFPLSIFEGICLS